VVLGFWCRECLEKIVGRWCLDFGAGSVLKKLWGGGVRILAQGVFGRNCGAVVLGFWCRECLKELRGVGVLVQGVF